MKLMATFDNNTETVPPIQEWQDVQGTSPMDACAEFLQTEAIVGPLPPNPIHVLVARRDHYEQRGWGGVLVHKFTATVRRE
jgi:hypothetical protein